jgi:hypothetical protein
MLALGGRHSRLAYELAEAKRLGSDLAVEGVGVEVGQRCTVAHEA